MINSIHFHFHFHLFYFLDLELGFNIMSHSTITSHDHMIMCHIEHCRRFQNNNVIPHVTVCLDCQKRRKWT